MRKLLRELTVDAQGNHGLALAMPPARMRKEDRLEFQEEILPAIENARQALFNSGDPDYAHLGNLEGLAKAAGHSVSTWHAWRRKNPTSPKFFDLRDFMRAVGLTLRLVSHGNHGIDGTGTVQVRTVDGGTTTLKPDTMVVVELMESLSDETRAAIKRAAFAENARLHNTEGARPHGNP